MKKAISVLVCISVIISMVLVFSGCSFEEEETTTTTVKVRTPLPTDITSSYDEDGSLLTDTEYTPEKLAANTATIFEYFNIHINELKGIKAGVSMRHDKSIGKSEITKTVKDENGNDTEETESIPYSENDYVNTAIDSLKDMMLNEPREDAEYGDDLKDFLPVKGESYVSSLTLGDVESATCVDSESERTVTVTLKSPALPETLEKAYDMGNPDDALAEFKKAEKYITVEKPVLTYLNCQIIIRADLETDEITSIEYIKNIDVKTSVTGTGSLSDIGTVPVQFRYRDSVSYSLDRTDPSAPKEIK